MERDVVETDVFNNLEDISPSSSDAASRISSPSRDSLASTRSPVNELDSTTLAQQIQEMLTDIHQEGDGDSDAEEREDVGWERDQEDVDNAGAVSDQADEDEPMPDDPILDFDLVDHMPNWPNDFPTELLHSPNPPPSTPARPSRPLGFLTLALYYVVIALSARFGATVRASNFVLQSVGALLQFCISVQSSAPLISSSDLSNFSPAGSARTAMNQLQIQADYIVLPVCPNHKCFKVWYGTQSLDRFDRLPETCPDCGESMYAEEKPCAKRFARVSLSAYLTRFLAVRGMEQLVEMAESRRCSRETQDDAFRQTLTDISIEKIYRERADGAEYQRLQRLLDAKAQRYADSLTLQLDLYIDW